MDNINVYQRKIVPIIENKSDDLVVLLCGFPWQDQFGVSDIGGKRQQGCHGYNYARGGVGVYCRTSSAGEL